MLVTSTPLVGKFTDALKKFVPLNHIGILVVLKVLSLPDGDADTQNVFVDDNGVVATILKCLEPVKLNTNPRVPLFIIATAFVFVIVKPSATVGTVAVSLFTLNVYVDTDVDGADADDVPPMFVAVAVNVYGVLVVNPVTIIGDDEPLPVPPAGLLVIL